MLFTERLAPVSWFLHGAGSRRVVSAVLAAAMTPSLAMPVEGPVLAKPHQDLSAVVPLRVLDEIDLSDVTPKVASKPELSWRPALNGSQPASTPDSKENADRKPATQAAKPADEPAQLRPVISAPMLVAPQVSASTPTPPSVAAPAKEPAPKEEAPKEPAPREKAPVEAPAIASDQADPIKAADAPMLPLRAHRPSPGSAASSTPAAPAVEKPLTTTPAPIAKPTFQPFVETRPVEKPAEKPVAARPVAPPATQSAAQPLQPTPPQTGAVAAVPVIVKPQAGAPQAGAPQAAEPLPPLSRNMRNLRSRLRTVLSFYYRKPLNTVEHDPWELMHAMLAYELHSRVRDGGPNGPYMTLVGHLCFNRPSKRQQLMIINKDGKLEAEVGVGVQGHRGQFLAMLAQCNVSPDYPIRVGGQDLTIHDLIDSEKRSCYAKTELTFKLIGLGHYLASDATWVNDQGETWDIPRLIKEERSQPIRGAACGGTHRLSGLSLAFRRREARGETLDGEYAEAARFVQQYQAYAFQLQNEDGSLSTEWFAGRGAEEDIERRLRTTGHILEWLVYSLPDDQLQSARTVRTVNYLTELLASNADHEWHLGSIGHAIHALVLYDKRVFRPHDPDNTQVLAAVDPTGNLYREYPIYRGVMRNSPPQPAGFLGLFGTQKPTSSRR